MQLAFAVAPDPGVGPAQSNLEAVRPTFDQALSIFSGNLAVAAAIAVGAAVTGWTAISRSGSHPRPRLILYLLLLASAYWLYFVSGVDSLAAALGVSRPQLTLELVHGYLEWPALLLPWAAIAFAIGPRRRLDRGLIAAACACSVLLLAAAAVLETFVVPDLLANGA